MGAADFNGDGRADIITGTSRHFRQYRVVDGITSSGVRTPALNGIEGELQGTFYPDIGVQVA